MACKAQLGTSTSEFEVMLTQAPQATLEAPCIAASILRIKNEGGKCVQAWHPQAKKLEISGSDNVEVFFKGQDVPSAIQIKDINESKAGTRVHLRFSMLESDRLKKGAVSLTGTVKFALPTGGHAVTLTGCGVDTINHNVKDTKGVSAVLVKNVCHDTAAKALAALQTIRKQGACIAI